MTLIHSWGVANFGY